MNVTCFGFSGYFFFNIRGLNCSVIDIIVIFFIIYIIILIIDKHQTVLFFTGVNKWIIFSFLT